MDSHECRLAVALSVTIELDLRDLTSSAFTGSETWRGCFLFMPVNSMIFTSACRPIIYANSNEKWIYIVTSFFSLRWISVDAIFSNTFQHCRPWLWVMPCSHLAYTLWNPLHWITLVINNFISFVVFVIPAIGGEVAHHNLIITIGVENYTPSATEQLQCLLGSSGNNTIEPD